MTFCFVHGRKSNTGGKCSLVFCRSTSSLACIFTTGGAHRSYTKPQKENRDAAAAAAAVNLGRRRHRTRFFVPSLQHTRCTHARTCRGTSALRRAQQQQQQQVVLPAVDSETTSPPPPPPYVGWWREDRETETGFSRRVCGDDDDGVPLLLPISVVPRSCTHDDDDKTSAEYTHVRRDIGAQFVRRRHDNIIITRNERRRRREFKEAAGRDKRVAIYNSMSCVRTNIVIIHFRVGTSSSSAIV